jgi:hypothetical protein
MRQLHEMLWYLVEACGRTFDPDAADRAGRLADFITDATRRDAPGLFALDLEALHAEVRDTLVDISEEVRAPYFAGGGPDRELHPGADLAGRNLRTRRLCGADLRGACLIAADLRGADLAAADLLGADLRDARLEDADLSAALYLAQPQLNAARGSRGTLLPRGLRIPPHWS